MKLVRLLVFAVAAIHISFAQETAQRAPKPEATLHYIHATWDTLTRSMTDCHSLVDIKVTANPILYLPAGMAEPPQVQALTAKCHVKVEALPRHIEKIGDIDPRGERKFCFEITPQARLIAHGVLKGILGFFNS